MTDQPHDPTQPHDPAQGAPAPTGQPAPPPEQRAPYGQQPAPYGQQQDNAYGGYSTAPVYANQGPAQPGSVRYVEQHFGQVASFGQRVLALLVDSLISLAAFIPMFVAIPILVAGSPRRNGVDEYGYPTMGEADTGTLTIGFVVLGLGLLLGIGINLWNRVFRMGRTGQSLGKSALGLRLVHAQTGQPIGAGSCFLRELASTVINQVVYLSYLWMLWDDNKQTLADKAVSSTVVVVPKG